MHQRGLIPVIISCFCLVLTACHSNTGKQTTKQASQDTAKTENTTEADTTLKMKPAEHLDRVEINLLAKAGKLSKHGHFKDAIRIYDSITTFDAGNSFIYSSRAAAYYTIGNLVQAEKDCNKAISLNEGNYYALYTHAQVMMFHRNFAKAKSDLDKAIEVKKDYELAYNLRGVAEGSRGDMQSAKKDLDKAISLSKTDPSAYYNRALVYSGMNMPDSEMKDYERALKIFSDYTDARNNLGIVKEKHLKDYKGAIEEFTKVIKIDPKNAKAYYNRGKCKLMLNKTKGAINDLSEAIKLNPNYGSAYQQRSMAYSKLGNEKKAAEDMKMARQLAPR